MPRLNGTGPIGTGPKTGRGAGPCGGGGAWGRKGSFCWRRFWGYYPTATPTKKEEKEFLLEEARIMEEELKNINSRLAELKDDNK